MNLCFLVFFDTKDEALILFASDSAPDVLGYEPMELVSRSWYDISDDSKKAKQVVETAINKKIRSRIEIQTLVRKDGQRVRTHITMTRVRDIMVACVSLGRGSKPEKNGVDPAPVSVGKSNWAGLGPDQDPRRHMMEHLAHQFQPNTEDDSVRAVLVTNRYSTVGGILWADHVSAEILNVPLADLHCRSIFEFIAPEHLNQCVDAVSRAKENDSIAALCFKSKHPRDDDLNEPPIDLYGAPFVPGKIFATVSATTDGCVWVISQAPPDLPLAVAAPWGVVPILPPEADLAPFQHLDPNSESASNVSPKGKKKSIPSAYSSQITRLLHETQRTASYAWDVCGINPDLGRVVRPGDKGESPKTAPHFYDSIVTKGDLIRSDPNTPYNRRNAEWNQSIQMSKRARKRKLSKDGEVKAEPGLEKQEEEDAEGLDHYVEHGYPKPLKRRRFPE